MRLDRLKNTFFNTQWHFMRWMRLGIGLLAILNTLISKVPWNDRMNIFILGIGIYFVAQAILGWGCAGNNCQIPSRKTTNNN